MEDFMSVALSIGFRLVERKIGRGGIVFAFSDEDYAPISLNKHGVSYVEDLGGKPYDGEITDIVDKLLEKEDTIGFTTDSERVAWHLYATGTFEFEGGQVVRYIRKDRTYHVFDKPVRRSFIF